MHVALINVSGRLSTDGSRLISALLKRRGDTVTTIFLSRRTPMRYEAGELMLLDRITEKAGIVMISVYSSYAQRARQVTRFIHERRPGTKVIWGGPHCISVPELGLADADGVCFAEGDEAVPDLVARLERGGNEWLSTPGFAFRGDDRVHGDAAPHGIVRNPVPPPFRDLDSLPFYDYGFEDAWILDRELIPLTRDLLKARLASYPYRIPIFYFMTSRGCPHNCSYCNNCRYLALWGRVPIRLHSVGRVIDEVEHQLAHLGFIEFVGFGDDDFFVRPQEQIEEFASLYRARIGLPFGIAVSARTYRAQKLEPMIDAGLKMVQMGVQSGSQRVLTEVFNRSLGVERTRSAALDIAERGRPRDVDLALDFIIDNPWETRKDAWRTFRFILGLPRWIVLNIFYLTFFPGTPLYDRARAEGFIASARSESSGFWAQTRLRYQRSWETFLIVLARFVRLAARRSPTAGEAFLRFCGSRALRIAMRPVPGALFSTLAGVLQRIVLAAAKRKERERLAPGSR
jgi:radical SAM superfamily enzyme YgiQ (UPF0313 family)